MIHRSLWRIPIGTSCHGSGVHLVDPYTNVLSVPPCKHVQVHGDGRECRPCELTVWQKIRRKIAVQKLRVMCIGDDIGHRRHHVAELGGFIDLVPHMCSPAQERG